MSVDFSRENLSSLTKDGVTEDLFKLLWAKDELNFSPMINVPDTIIYKYGQPVSWYFTSVNGHVKKKNKSNLISAKIEEAFTKHILGYDVIGYFISMPSEHENHQSNGNTSDFQTIVEYFDREGLKQFLYNHRKEVNGILQRFIEPKSTHNEVIRGIWSPKLCLLERAENIHALHDVRYGLYEKCVVYEGPDYYYTSAPLRGPVLSGQLQKLCESTVSHISEVTFGQKQVSRIVLNFKVDSRDKIWLLYSTSIRTIDMLEYNPLDTLNGTVRNLVNIDSVLSLAETVHLNPKKQYSKIKPRIRIPCLSCGKEELEEMRHPVTYKSIIKHYDHVLYLMKLSTTTNKKKIKAPDGKDDVVVKWPPDDELIESAGGVGFGCVNADEDRNKKHQKLKYLKDLQVPPILGALHPKLVVDTYLRCKDDPLFLNKTVHVCEACYLVFAEFQTMLLQLGGNLTKLLTPDPAAGTIAVGPKSDIVNRPTSADWRAISSTASHSGHSVSAGSASLTTLSRGALRHQEQAKSRAIGIRSSDTRMQPEVPEVIRSPHHAQDLNEFTFSTINTNEMPPFTPYGYGNSNSSIRSGSANGGSLYRGGLLENDGNSTIATSTVYDPQDVHSMIADRERRFFKEISLNPQLKDQHPLMHIISAQQKLKLVDQQSGVLSSKSANESASIFGSKYGKQPGDKHDPLGPYNAELPYILNGEVVLPSQLKIRKKQQALEKNAERQRSIKSFLLADDGDGNSTIASAAQSAVAAVNNSKSSAPVKDTAAKPSATSNNAAIDNNIKSSKKYRDFLSESLKKIQADVEGAAPFRNTNFINSEVDENGLTIETAQGTADTANSKRGKIGRDSTVAEKSNRSVPISQKIGVTGGGVSSSQVPALPSKKRMDGEASSSRDYHFDFNLDDAPVFPISTSANSSVVPPPQPIPPEERVSESSKNVASASEISAKGPISPKSPKSQVVSGKVTPESKKANSKKSPKAAEVDVVQPQKAIAVEEVVPTGDHDDESLLSPLPKFMPGQVLEEDSSLLISSSLDKMQDISAVNGDVASEGDGFSISHSEAFAGLNDDHNSIASMESLGHSLEGALNHDFGDESMLLSPDNTHNKSQIQASMSKVLASEESLIKEQADALLQMSGSTSLPNNDIDVN